VIGVMRKGRKCPLNPADSKVYEEGEELIVLAEDASSYKLRKEKEMPQFKIEHVRQRAHSAVALEEEHVLILGWRRNFCAFLSELCKMKKGYIKITILAKIPKEKQEQRLFEESDDSVYEKIKDKLTHLYGCPTSRLDLEDLEVPLTSFHTIFVMADVTVDCSTEEKDGNSLNSMLLLVNLLFLSREGMSGVSDPEFCKRMSRRSVSDEVTPQSDLATMLKKIQKDVKLVVELLGTRWLAGIGHVENYILTNDLVSSALAMVTECRAVTDILTELLDDAGSELYIRDILDYVPEHRLEREMTFWEVMAHVRQQNAVCLGYMSSPENNPKPELNPPNKDMLELWKDAKLIVLSQD